MRRRSGAPSVSISCWMERSRKNETRLRITLRLLDLRAGNQIVWARRFDRQAHDLLSLQDEVAAEVVAQIDPEILLIEAKRIAARPPVDATAYDLVLRALPLIGRMERGHFMRAGELLSRGDRAGAGLCRRSCLVCLLARVPCRPRLGRESKRGAGEAGQLAERAIVLDPLDARGLTDRRTCAGISASPAARGSVSA